MAEFPHNIDTQYTQTLPNGNNVCLDQGEIRAFIDASVISTDTQFTMRRKPYRKSIFSGVTVTGCDLSSRQSQAIEVVAYFKMADNTLKDKLFEKIEALLTHYTENDEIDPLNEFEFIDDGAILSIDSPSGQRYFLYLDNESDTITMINSGSVPLDNSAPENFVTTRPDSFDYVSSDSQIMEFCVAISEFLQLADEAHLVQKRRTTRKPSTFDFRLEGYAKNKLTRENPPCLELALDLGRTAISDKPSAILMPAQEKLDDDPRIRYNDIAGYDAQKKELMVCLAVHQNPHMAARYGLSPTRGILLYGPAGTGKTSLAEACATEMGAKVIKITSEFYAKYVGDSTSNLAKFFNDAEQATEPLVLLLDELDALVQSSGNSGVDKSVLGLFKQRLAAITNPNVIVIGTTNNKDSIDETILRSGRFDTKIYIPLPDASNRMAIFAKYISDGSGRIFVGAQAAQTKPGLLTTNDYFELFDSTVDTNALADLTDEFSGADIKTIIDQAKRQKLYEEIETGECSLITQEDLFSAIRAFKQS